jgi:hypothetical protein
VKARKEMRKIYDNRNENKVYRRRWWNKSIWKGGLLDTAEGKIFVAKTLKREILMRFHDSPFAGPLWNVNENTKI